MTFDQMETLFRTAPVTELRQPSTRHPCREIAAMLLLAELAPEVGSRVVATADDDVIYFAADPFLVAPRITEDNVCELARLGVRLGFGQFSMAV